MADHLKGKTRRLFFAIVPDVPTRNAILRATRGAVRATKGSATTPANLHVTVAFLGNVEASLVEAARSAAPVDAMRFELALGRYSNRHGMLWLEPLAMPEALASLERSLWERLERLGFEREPRAYRPHFTLARDVSRPIDGVVDLHWTVRSLELMESVGGANGPTYVSIGTWPLANPVR